MKKLAIIALLLSVSFMIRAQGIGDWFSQKATQTKLLVQQIAALEVYKSYIKTGYKIAGTGLNAISDFKNGEFSLHKLFFQSLKTVSPAIKKYPMIADILIMQYEIIKTASHSRKRFTASNGYTPEDIKYTGNVYGRVLETCERLVNELTDLMTDGKLEMRDDERIERITRLYEEVADLYAFSQYFSSEALQLGASRLHEAAELKRIKQWFNKE